ncbi:MAG: PilZ domain-containing protein [Desulfuromonadales bacterium]|nr:PilZ domain-containing protein [Desulfuromonadales bacterium]
MSMKILLPDEEAIADILKSSFLYRSGFTFLTVASGDELIQQIEEHDPVLVVLDIEKAGLNSEECCKKIKKCPVLRKTPVIMIVPKEMRNNNNQCQELSCEAVIGRPIDPQRFLTTASHLLGIYDRAAPRIESFLVVSCGADLDELHEGWIRNINTGGCYIETTELLPIDYRINIQFSPKEGDELLCCRARVAWVNHPEWIKCEQLPPGMGVQFIDLDEATAEQIQNYIAENVTIDTENIS